MDEKSLQFIWNKQMFDTSCLKCSKGQDIKILDRGILNKDAGPDFCNCKIKIDDVVFAGSIEIHRKSSDWDKHSHRGDKNYSNIILHVVWENDKNIIDDNFDIPTLQICDLVDKKVIENFKELIHSKKRQKCKDIIKNIDKTWPIYSEYLFLKRIKRKVRYIEDLLDIKNNDWENVLFVLICKYLGGKVNRESFYNLANSIDFKIIRRESYNLTSLEAIMYGQAGMLNENIRDDYYLKLKSEYDFFKNKYKLSPLNKHQFKFSKIRPYSFPTIRISQISNLYFKNRSIFLRLMKYENIEEIKNILDVKASEYWDDHFNFSKKSEKKVQKKLTSISKEHLIINSILPLIFKYKISRGYDKKDVEEEIISLAKLLKPEQNSVIDVFEGSLSSNNVLETQALLELNTEMCERDKCLECDIFISSVD